MPMADVQMAALKNPLPSKKVGSLPYLIHSPSSEYTALAQTVLYRINRGLRAVSKF